MTTTPGDAAQLAVAVLDAEAEREAQQAAAKEEVLFADRPAARSRGGAGLARPGAACSGGVGRSSCCCCCASLEELEVGDAVGARPRHPRLVRGEQRRHRVPRGGVRSVSRARRTAHGVAGRPLPPSADHRLGEPRVRSLRRARAVRSPTRSSCSGRGSGSAIAKSNSIPVHGSMIADTYPISARGRINAWLAMGVAFRRCAEPGRRRRHRGGRRRRRRLALAVPAARASRSRSWRSSRSSCGSRPAVSSRSRTCSARSSRTRSRRRSRSRPRSRGSGRSGRSRPSSSRSRRSGFGLFTATGAHQPVHGGPLRHRARSSGACSAPSAASACCSCCPSSGSTTTPLPARSLAGAAVRGDDDPPRRAPHAGAVLHAQRRAVHDPGHPAADPAPHDRVHDGADRSCSRSCPTGCGAWVRRWGRSTSSSSARPAARCSPGC